ncbi:hypothetical protein M5K25_004611 [Dendrobium thyrsiflorum]|uniref:Uncharacterized protein n=1 Tax=Dendrobium thyrsiflorum TaxID=117978 RepID=A0ABD0VMF8_DENTH
MGTRCDAYDEAGMNIYKMRIFNRNFYELLGAAVESSPNIPNAPRTCTITCIHIGTLRRGKYNHKPTWSPASVFQLYTAKSLCSVLSTIPSAFQNLPRNIHSVKTPSVPLKITKSGRRPGRKFSEPTGGKLTVVVWINRDGGMDPEMMTQKLKNLALDVAQMTPDHRTNYVQTWWWHGSQGDGTHIEEIGLDAIQRRPNRRIDFVIASATLKILRGDNQLIKLEMRKEVGMHLKAKYKSQGYGMCPLTDSFATKWHRRINSYDSGPSEPSGSTAKWHHDITVMASARMLPNGIKSLRYESIEYNR